MLGGVGVAEGCPDGEDGIAEGAAKRGEGTLTEGTAPEWGAGLAEGRGNGVDNKGGAD